MLVFPLAFWACAGSSEKQQEQQASKDSVEAQAGQADKAETADVEKQESQDVQPLTDEGIDAISKVWRDRPFNVEPGDITPGVHEFAYAICEQYPGFEANKKMMEYLMDNDECKKERWGYHVTDQPRMGYLRCSSMTQYDTSTTCCYWKRQNGHQLVAVYMNDDHENGDDQQLVAFYDYDPATDVLTPEPKLTEMVENLGKGYDDYEVNLPEKGKDIEVDAFTFSDDSAQEHQYFLIWNGQTFTVKK